MTNMSLRIIIGLMIAAVFGIISLQVYWLGKAMDLSNQNFQVGVRDALMQVVQRLEQEEVDNFFVFESSGTQIKLQGGTMFIGEGQEEITLRVETEVTDVDSPLIRKVYKKKVTKNGVIEENISIDKLGDWQMNPPVDNGRIVQILSRTLQGATSPRRSLQERIDPDHIDSLIAESLKDQGVNLGFNFMVTQGRGANIVYKTAQADAPPLLESAYKVRMFPSLDPFGGNVLSIFFPNQSLHGLRSVWMLALASILFTGIILGCFWVTVRTILKQKKVSEMKNDFINNMTHEFKTPLATISLATDALGNEKVKGDPVKSAYYTGIIKEENQRMNQQVERVLQIARSEIQLRKETLDAHSIIRKAVEKNQLHVEQRGGMVTINLEATRAHVFADEVHLRNLIHNLLENANKYSPDSPQIGVHTFNEGEDLVIEISDHGLGINATDQERIFERFFRVSTGNLHDVKGFGLGLSYVKEITEAHGGEISVTSKPGEGSVFIVCLPLTDASHSDIFSSKT